MTEFVTVQELSCLHVPDRSDMEDFIPLPIRSKTSIVFNNMSTGELMVRFPNNRGVQMFWLSPNEKLDFVTMQITFDQQVQPRFILFEDLLRTAEFNVQIMRTSTLAHVQEYMMMVADGVPVPLISRNETLFSTFEGTDVRFYIPPCIFRPFDQYRGGMTKDTLSLTESYWRPEVRDILDHLEKTKTD